MHILKIVNKGLLCKSADKYGMQKMGPEHRSSLNNRHCILCDLTTICSSLKRLGLTQFSCDCHHYQNSSHSPHLPITPTLQHCDRWVTCNYSQAAECIKHNCSRWGSGNGWWHSIVIVSAPPSSLYLFAIIDKLIRSLTVAPGTLCYGQGWAVTSDRWPAFKFKLIRAIRNYYDNIIAHKSRPAPPIFLTHHLCCDNVTSM